MASVLTANASTPLQGQVNTNEVTTRLNTLEKAHNPISREALTTATAERLNASIPYFPKGQDTPSPFILPSATLTFARAMDCLASAVLYEAGDDPVGQAAVAQVVLNRVRHPAFPNSICGVVYQGSERHTGCQFTFTCDGALKRPPSATAWQRAQITAALFLSGRTDPTVGMATHYHTDWVHPYWSQTLDKIAKVDTHIFFRWRGNWGRKAAFSSAYAYSEPEQYKLAALSQAHSIENIPAENFNSESFSPKNSSEHLYQSPRPSDPSIPPIRHYSAHNAGEYFLMAESGTEAAQLALHSLGLCKNQVYCKVMGLEQFSRLSKTANRTSDSTVTFLYVRDRRTRVEIVLWDCALYKRQQASQCLSEENRDWIEFQGDLSAVS